MTRKTIHVELSAKDMQFIQWLAKRDGLTVQQSMQAMFETELVRLEEALEREMDKEKTGE